jgi:glutamate racemase
VNNSRPIGIFDSGVGGLTVFSEIRKKFPSEDLIYFGDTARVPYGPKSKNTVIEYSIQNARFLLSFQVKMIIVACNTSSAVAIKPLQELFPVPVIGVLQPGAELAAATTKNNRIGIIGTEGTINSGAYPLAIEKINKAIKSYSVACPLFVPLVEEGWQDHHVTKEIVSEYLAELLDKSIDTLVLACTHYPILKAVIKQVAGEDINLIDSAETLACYLESQINNMESTDSPQNGETGFTRQSAGKDYFYVSDNEEKFRKIASMILNKEIQNLVRVKLAESWFV